MDLNALLHEKNIDPKTVMVLRHRPEERELRKVLPWLAGERPEVFNAFQQNHGDRVQNALTKAKHLASFIAHGGGKRCSLASTQSKGGSRSRRTNSGAFPKTKR